MALYYLSWVMKVVSVFLVWAFGTYNFWWSYFYWGLQSWGQEPLKALVLGLFMYLVASSMLVFWKPCVVGVSRK